jgi:flagellar basal-body rod modification protein FlgD
MLSSVTGPSEASEKPAGANAGAFAKGSDFTMFLKMLTTQMQNQNPLNPVEAADFAVQLATFSGVEQQVQTNQLLARLTERALSDDLGAWLGNDVAAGAEVQIGTGPVSLHLPAAIEGATRRELVLLTASGAEVTRITVSTDQRSLAFDPAADGALPLLPGKYRAQVLDYAGADPVHSHDAAQFSEVREVRKGTTGTLLVLHDGRLLDPATVIAVRRP